jgi:hypothetical protein
MRAPPARALPCAARRLPGRFPAPLAARAPVMPNEDLRKCRACAVLWLEVASQPFNPPAVSKNVRLPPQGGQ